MTEQNALLLDSTGMVVNVIVINNDTPADFLKTLVADDKGFYAPVTETVLVKPNSNITTGWRRTASGKFDPPILPEQVDVVAELVADERLNDLTDVQASVLEEVLSERLGRPTSKP